MQNPYYAQGITAALTELQLQKTAANAYTALSNAATGLFPRLNNIGTAVENRFFKLAPKTKPYLEGAVNQGLNEAVVGSMFGGAMGAGFGALGAEPGERWQGALQGIRPGILSGAAYGAISGVARRPIQNYSTLRLKALATQKGHSPPAAAALANQEYYDKGWFHNVADLMSGKGSLGRKGSAIAAGGGLLGFGLADMYIPNKLVPEGAFEEKPTRPPAAAPHRITTAAEHKKKPSNDPLLPSTMLGSYVGGLGTNLSIRSLKHHKLLPFQRKLSPYALETIPIIATTAGAATGFITAKKLKQYLDQNAPASKK